MDKLNKLHIESTHATEVMLIKSLANERYIWAWGIIIVVKKLVE